MRINSATLTGILSTILVLSAAPAPTHAGEDPIPVEHFAQLPLLSDVLLSPNGEYLAALAPVEGELRLYIAPVERAADQQPYIGNLPKATFNWINWASNERLIFSYTTVIRFGNIPVSLTRRLGAVNRDGSDGKILTHRSAGLFEISIQDDVLHTLHDDPDHVLYAFAAEGEIYPAVHKLNIHTGESTAVVAPVEPIMDWYADHDGLVRFGVGWKKKKAVMLARSSEAPEWHPLHEHNLFKDQRFRPMGFGFDPKILYVRSPIPHGRDVIYRFDLEAGELIDKVFEHPKVDALGVVFSPVSREVAAALYLEDTIEYEVFDEQFAKSLALINKALPDRTNLIEQTAGGGQYHLVYSYSPTEAGRYYRYDTEAKVLHLIAAQYPELEPDGLADMQPVTYFARDGIEIPAYLTLPKGAPSENLPTVIMPHGGPWVRDSLVFDPWVQFLANRGYAVLQPNFRGSSGYGSAFIGLSFGEWGRAMQDDISDGVKWLVRKGISDPARICIVGASYGGYAALMGTVKTPELFHCAAAFAPVTDISLMLKNLKGNAEYDLLKEQIKGNRSNRDLREVSPLKQAKKIKTPVLLVHGDEDLNVSVEHSRKLAKALKKQKTPHQLIVLEGGGHGMRKQEHRVKFFRALEAFLAEHIGGPARTAEAE